MLSWNSKQQYPLRLNKKIEPALQYIDQTRMNVILKMRTKSYEHTSYIITLTPQQQSRDTISPLTTSMLHWNNCLDQFKVNKLIWTRTFLLCTKVQREYTKIASTINNQLREKYQKLNRTFVLETALARIYPRPLQLTYLQHLTEMVQRLKWTNLRMTFRSNDLGELNIETSRFILVKVATGEREQAILKIALKLWVLEGKHFTSEKNLWRLCCHGLWEWQWK